MRKFNKKKLPSRHTSIGADRAPHRSFYYAMGETEKDVSKPFVGCLLYTSDAADDSLRVDLGGRRIIKKNYQADIHL